jgi:hypothetical protein
MNESSIGSCRQQHSDRLPFVQTPQTPTLPSFAGGMDGGAAAGGMDVPASIDEDHVVAQGSTATDADGGSSAMDEGGDDDEAVGAPNDESSNMDMSGDGDSEYITNGSVLANAVVAPPPPAPTDSPMSLPPPPVATQAQSDTPTS